MKDNTMDFREPKCSDVRGGGLIRAISDLIVAILPMEKHRADD